MAGGYKTPKEALNVVRTIGAARAKQPTDQILLLSFVSGCYIAFGAYCAVLVGGNVPQIKATNPGIQKLLYGIAFTVGLMMTTLTGSDLYTGNVFTITFAIMSKKTRFTNAFHALKGVILTFIGNMLGGLFVAYFFVYLLTPDQSEPWVEFLKSMAVKKTHKNVGLLLLSGIGCNWIVSTAVFMNYTAEDVSGKILAMFLPVMAFAIYGFEHVVANAFFLPAAAMFGANVPVWRIVFWNYLPVAVGNYIGGVVFVGGLFWYAHMMRPKHHDVLENLAKKMWHKMRGNNNSATGHNADLDLELGSSAGTVKSTAPYYPSSELSAQDVSVAIKELPCANVAIDCTCESMSNTTTTTATSYSSDNYGIDMNEKKGNCVVV